METLIFDSDSFHKLHNNSNSINMLSDGLLP